jgi:hypothetical protein
LLILCATTIAHAQSTNATISGVVVDPSGKIIPDARVEIVNDATGVHHSSETNETGIYSVTILPPGEYRVQVSKIGFKTLIKPGIVLNVESAVALNFTLPVGATSESITVEGGASQINTTDGSVSTVIDRDFVENMPLNGRSFQDLLTLSPGVAQVANSQGIGYGVGFSGDIVVNGQRAESNDYSVDGVSANTGSMPSSLGPGAGVSGNLPGLTALGTTQSLVSVDALQEFRSTTSTYSAEYGRSPGGQFSFQTRSGTNALRGSLYDYFRNDALDASNWFNDYYGYPKGKERQNDFGGTVGGPVVLPHLFNGEDRTFFFLSYEGLRLVSPQAAMQVLVPDAALRAQSPAAIQSLLNVFPVANGGSDGLNDGFAYYIESVSYPSHLDNLSIRLDHSFGRRLTLFGRYADSPSETTTYNGAIKDATENHTQTVTLGTTYTLSPRQTNDLRFNFTANDGEANLQSTNLGGATPFQLGNLPGPGGNAFPQKNSEFYVIFTFASDARFELSDLPNAQHQINVTDTHNWTVGRHSFKAGIDWRRLITSLAYWNPVEEVVFEGESQVLQNAAALTVAQTFGTARDEPEYINFSGFIQDEWRPVPRLGLSLGLRWDVNPAPTNADGPAPYTITEVSDLSTTKLAPQGTPLWNTDWRGLAPRFGIAYQLRPGSDRNTVLRAGFGMFYDAGNTEGSLGFSAIGFESSQDYFSASFPLTSAQLTLPAPSAVAPYATGVYGFDPNLKLPYSLQYNATVEQALSRRESLTLSYVGSGGRRLLTEWQTYPGALGDANFASRTNLLLVEGRASSSYSSLQAKYQRSVVRGVQALVSYTWSHSIDDASSNFSTYDLLRASSDFDIRQNLEAAATLMAPRVNSWHKGARLLNDWGLDLRLQARTALPVNTIGALALEPESGLYLQYQPNLVIGQPFYVYGNQYPGGRAINYYAIQTAAAGVQGDLPRNYARAFGAVQLDTAVRRDIEIRDRFHLQARIEAFNLFNHAMFGAIDPYLSDGPDKFGRAENTLNSLGNLNSLYQVGGPRSLQASLKLQF